MARKRNKMAECSHVGVVEINEKQICTYWLHKLWTSGGDRLSEGGFGPIAVFRGTFHIGCCRDTFEKKAIK
ncbi:hypothetical protein KIN20_033611 [Parelaphostrongylus tenuis]|uniref:Uncharacterized protein n=1 Tax=Parelaphostrongylus tenuis TaxID=148309 RepID=A0AAD5R8Y3_PARTN|nr:hypothetical protein KIN20_033611 [Parelaphostrongylus tenuis]